MRERERERVREKEREIGETLPSSLIAPPVEPQVGVCRVNSH